MRPTTGEVHARVPTRNGRSRSHAWRTRTTPPAGCRPTTPTPTRAGRTRPDASPTKRYERRAAPYNNSNISSDEVIYYVAGNFMSRRGVEISSFTLHPEGIPHGPHPGTVEASIGKEGTEELAVMVDTFQPLNVTREASRLEDESYPYSWLPPDDADQHARELSERGPEASPIDAF